MSEYDKPIEQGIQFPPALLEQFTQTSFCPSDLIRGHPECGTSFNTLRVECFPGSDSDYPSALMFKDCAHAGEVLKASQPFADWGRSRDAEFIKAVVDWLQGMTAVKHGAEATK